MLERRRCTVGIDERGHHIAEAEIGCDSRRGPGRTEYPKLRSGDGWCRAVDLGKWVPDREAVASERDDFLDLLGKIHGLRSSAIAPQGEVHDATGRRPAEPQVDPAGCQLFQSREGFRDQVGTVLVEQDRPRSEPDG